MNPQPQAQKHATGATASKTVDFSAADGRANAMRAAVDNWLGELRELVDDAAASDAFRDWLDVQSRFHDYSYRNTLLIKLQRPDATTVAGFRSWQTDFDRQVREGETAIWIWAPLLARTCPACDRRRSRHESDESCDFDGTPPEEWPKGVIGFKPVPVFDVAQTEGEPLATLETAATGDGSSALQTAKEAAENFDIPVSVIPSAEWTHGGSAGVCRWGADASESPVIEVRARADDAAVAGTVLHELAHARLHGDRRGRSDRAQREVEAEAIAYLVGRHLGLDTTNSAFYLAAWQGDDRDRLGERLHRIRREAATLIEAVQTVHAQPTTSSS